MATNRRDLLSLLPLAGTSALMFMGALGRAEAQDSAQAQTPADQTTYDFWTQDIRNPESADARARGIHSAARASFVYFDEQNGFLAGNDIGDGGLRDSGDLDILVNVDHIRPSVDDQQRFANLEGGSLRIDFQQGMPMPNLAERLAWTAIAGFLPENRQLPALKEMTFKPGEVWGKLQTVPMPGGAGLWTWNFTLQKRKGRWMQLFDVIRRNKGLLAPIFGLGLPAIAVTALATVDSVVAEISKDERTEWLFQSPDVYFYATKRARDAFEGSKLRLKTGMYVIMPSDRLGDFAKVQHSLTLKDGLIVPKNTTGLEVESASRDTIKDITYLTVGVSAKLRPATR